MRLAVVGATGIVGRQLLWNLERSGEQPQRIGLFASAASAGRRILFGGEQIAVQDVESADFAQFDAALFAIGDEHSARLVPKALAAGCVVVDKSSVYRLQDGVPLVVSGVNDSAITLSDRLAANPNCSTIILTTALKPLLDRFAIEHVFAATYQSVSGAGSGALRELGEQCAAGGLLAAEALLEDMPDEQYAFNIIPGIGAIDGSGKCSEERKLVAETRKILGAPELGVIAHSVRVPVAIGHGIAVTVLLEEPVQYAEVLAALQAAPGILLKLDTLPTALSAARHDKVELGRLRSEGGERFDCAGRAWSFFVVGDNVNIGAALNGWRVLKALYAAALTPQAGQI